MILWLYRAAWEPALWAARLCAGLEKIAGGSLWPAHWRPADRLGSGPAPADARKTIWLHAASLGECKGLWAFAQMLRKTLQQTPQEPGARILLTANTVAGLDFLRARISAEENPGDWEAALAPLDHPRVAARFLRMHGVRALVLFEVELWPHWIFAARCGGVLVLWISARLTARARRLYAGKPKKNSWREAALRRVLHGVTWAQAQTDGDARALRDLGCRAVESGGDLRGLYYLGDRGAEGPDKNPASRAGEDSERRGIAFVSIHAQELPAIVPQIAAAGNASPLIVFPRKMEELPRFVAALAPLGFVLRSRQPDADRLIVDSFGRVAEGLARARAAVIGGSFLPDDRVGGHNLWEPLLSGARILIGPRHGNQEYLARKLAAAGLLRVLSADETLPFAAATDRNARETSREKFVSAESEFLKHAADRACEHLLKALFSG